MSEWPQRVGILGAGALGTLFAYQLRRHTSTEVWLFARSGGPGNLKVEGQPAVEVLVTNQPEHPVDLLIVLVKSYATADALTWASRVCGPTTVALTLQNGLGNAEAIAERLGPTQVLAGTTAQGATRLEPGLVRHAGVGLTYLGPWDAGGAAATRAPAVAALLSRAGIPTSVESDPQQLLWTKLAVSCGINALSALLRVHNGELLQRPSARRLLEVATAEAGAVARAAGVILAEDPVARALTVAKATASNRSSMLQDIERNQQTEIDAINGAVVDRGQLVGVPTPVNLVLTQLIKALTRSGRLADKMDCTL